MRANVTALVLLASVIHISAPSAARADEKTLTVATYNVNWGNPEPSKTVSVIRALRADVVALQETNRASQRWLTKHLKKTFPHAAFTKNDRGGAGGFGFVSKHELADVRFTPPTAGWFGSYSCRVRVNDATVRIVSVHLMPVLPKPGATVMGVLSMLTATEGTRKKEISALVGAHPPAEPTIVLGDFNSVSTQGAPTHMRTLGFLDSYAQAHKVPDTDPTWRWVYRGVPLAFRIDYVFHSPHFETTRCRIVREGPSDHYPVVGTLRFVSGKADVEVTDE